MRPFRIVLSMVALGLAAGCASGEAFVDRHYMTKTVKKQKLPGYDGNVAVCYDSAAPAEKRDQLAAEACDVYGLKALLVQELRWQCRLTAPHLASYVCVDPDMRTAGGGYVNPYNAGEVERWNAERRKADGGETPPDGK